jgi:hypothetical protein
MILPRVRIDKIVDFVVLSVNIVTMSSSNR